MLGVTLACSNAPSMYRPRVQWQAIYESQLTPGFPPPKEGDDETDEVIDGYLARIDAGFAILRERLQGDRPDALLVLGYDDGTCFTDVQVPQFGVYTGAELTGSTAIEALGESPEAYRVTLPVASDLAWRLQRELVDHAFDVSYMSEQRAIGRPEMGTTSAFTRPTSRLLEGLDLPLIPFFINCHERPAPTGHRCHALGTALGRVIESWPERVAVLAVGGLSNDPNGPRAGWIDNRLDNWVLDHLARGDSNRLKSIFDLDSDALRGGSGEIRTWITAAAAAETQGARAMLVDYFPSLKAITGIAFAHWQT
jgi:hypothetical protein